MTRDTPRGSSRSEEERAFLQQRLKLFWKAVFLIALVPDVVEIVLDPLGALLRTSAILDRSCTAFFGLLWLVCRRGRRSYALLLIIEWLGLAVVSLMITLTGRYLTAEALVHFIAQIPGTVAGLALEKAADAYVSIMMVATGGLLFALRAALVPSPPARSFLLTALLGIPFVAVPFYLGPASTGLPPLRTANFPVFGATTYTVWWAIVSVGATVISRVVYGLRSEVRRARRLGSTRSRRRSARGAWASSTARVTA